MLVEHLQNFCCTVMTVSVTLYYDDVTILLIIFRTKLD